MADTLRHRGPDDEGIVISGAVGLGFRRLSIIDLEGGHQPMTNETGDVLVVMNGEIYNFKELRRRLEAAGHQFRSRADTEVLVHLYEEKGEGLVDDLVGMFAFAIADLRRSTPRIMLARDRIGIKPLYYVVNNEGLSFASEPKALLATDLGISRLRDRSLLQFLELGYTAGQDSAWEKISRLLPGHVLSWTPGETPVARRYWDLPTEELRAPTDEEEVLAWLDRVVSDRLVADVPLGGFLSGGIDSAAVISSMARAATEPVIACTVGFTERAFDETELAIRTAQHVGATHHTQKVDVDPALALETLPWYFDEPHADPSVLPTFLVSQMTREHVTVALSGDGGDETFAGYDFYPQEQLEQRIRKLVGSPGRELARRLGSMNTHLDRVPGFSRGQYFLRSLGETPARAHWRTITQVERRDALALLNPDLREHLAQYDPFNEFEEIYHRPDIDDPLYRAQYTDFHTFLPEKILSKVDRASMAVSLEVRVPILDHRFCSRFSNLPIRQKIRGGRGKYAFREALRSRVPRAVLQGRKMGFDPPLAVWTRGRLAPAIRDALESLPSEWFDRSALRERHAEHASGQRNHSRLLWSLLILEHWRRRHDVKGLAVTL